MAEAALHLVINKISIAVAAESLKYAKPLFAKKKSVEALPDDMILIKNELELMQAFLKETSRTGWRGEVIETWIGQVRRLAYNMEDIVDQFIYVVSQHQQDGSWWGYVKKIVKKPQSLFTLDEIASEIKRINLQLSQLKHNSWTQPTSDVSDIPAANYDSQEQLYLPRDDYSIGDDELVGFDKSRNILIKSLHFEDCSLRIITLWGMGGIGKSTLVNNVYRNEVANFECHAWISVSQSYKLDDIWRNMVKNIYAKDKKEFDAEKMDSAELQVELKKILNKRRYLIILDDVWTAADLFQIKEILVDNGLGSRVIITTRMEEVASVADDGCKIKVGPLNDNYAWLLFCRKAFPRIKNHTCPSELHQCGKDIVEKCDGLPLALVAIGSVLSLKEKSVTQWRLFYDQLVWELHNNENLNRVEKILNLSYKYLPNYLKSCFLYCALFPEDYLIHRKRLIRLWIAEGFVEQRGACNLEDVAEGYLTELVRRSMLHVVEKNSFDRIRCLRMHDLVRELAIFQSKKESFSTTYDDTHGVVQVEKESRRVSVLRCNNISSIHPSRLRTFIAFDTSMASSLCSSFIPSECKYLAVLELSGLPIGTLPNSVGELFNLKFLGLDRTNVKELPKSVTKLHNLETVSLRGAQCLNFPRGSEKLKRLRHIRICKWLDETGMLFSSYESMEPFEGVWNLKGLRTLSSVRASNIFVAKLVNLSQLRTLCITEVRSSQCAQLCDSLSKMHQLSKLEIRASNEDEVLQLETLTLPSPLQKLTLIGCLSEGTMECSFFSTHGNALLTAHLVWCQLSENPVPHLSGLSNLAHLDLTRAYTGQELSFRAGGFPNLKKIYLHDLPYVNQIYIHEGALVSLEFLWIRMLGELRDVPTGLECLKSVKEARFTGMPPAFVRNLQTAMLDCIPEVYYST